MKNVEIYKCLAKAQGEFKTVCKDKPSGFGRKFAPLDSIVEMITPVLSKHGLGIMQLWYTDPSGEHRLTTRLYHESGEIIETDCRLDVSLSNKQNAQHCLASALTYFRRYQLCALLNVVTDEDDNDAKNNHETRKEMEYMEKKSGVNVPKTKEIQNFTFVKLAERVLKRGVATYLLNDYLKEWSGRYKDRSQDDALNMLNNEENFNHFLQQYSNYLVYRKKKEAS